MTPPPDAEPTTTSELGPWLGFAACSLIWGSTFLVISIGNDALAPVWGATLRLILATIALGLWARARGAPLPRGPALRAALGYGITQFGINFPLLYWAEQRVPSGLSAVIYATIPLSSALMTRAFGLEQLTARKLGGALVALVGVGVLFSGAFGQHLAVSGLAAILVGATASALGSVLLKLGPRQDPFAVNAVGSAVSIPVAAVASFALGESHAIPTTLGAAWPLLYLTGAGSLGAYVIMSWLVSRWSVTRTAYVTVVVPVIALGLGSVVRHERLTAVSLAGTALVFAGLFLGMGLGARRPGNIVGRP
jgi:drug/metabolite transporter (DMT)-like permease